MTAPELDLGLPPSVPRPDGTRRLVRFYLIKYRGKPVQRVKKLRGLPADPKCESCSAVLQRRNGEVVAEFDVPVKNGKPTVRGFGRRTLKLAQPK